MTVELFSKDECGLCDEARKILKNLKKEFLFDVKEVTLVENHPKFNEYFLAVPVVLVGGKEFKSQLRESELRDFFKNLKPPTRLFHVGKFLEALGFLTVAVGLMYGLMGDMWLDLFFFLGGILVFTIGRWIEKRELKRDRPATLPDNLPAPF